MLSNDEHSLPLQELYSKLYMQLSTDMHTAINQLILQAASKSDKPSAGKAATPKGKSQAAEGPSRHQLAVLRGLADEAELTGDQAAADRYHQERILAPANVQVILLLSSKPRAYLYTVLQAFACAWVLLQGLIQLTPVMLKTLDRQDNDSTSAHAACGPVQVWYEYGTFCMRTSKQGPAEQCLREAVAVDNSHKPALMALAALLWHTGLHTDSAHLDQAETVLHAAREAAPDDAAVWALLTLLYGSMAARRVSEHRNAAFEMRRLAKLSNRRKLAGNPYLQVCKNIYVLFGALRQKTFQVAGVSSLRLAIKSQSSYMPNTIKPCNHSCSYLTSHHQKKSSNSFSYTVCCQ